ncbi:hypothetical protein [Achromobacter sp. AGC39]
MIALYIVPAWSDQAGQCRIVRRDGPLVGTARESYRRDPTAWREVGLMNSRGELVCFDGPSEQLQELRDCAPLAAGLELRFPDSDAPAPRAHTD